MSPSQNARIFDNDLLDDLTRAISGHAIEHQNFEETDVRQSERSHRVKALADEAPLLQTGNYNRDRMHLTIDYPGRSFEAMAGCLCKAASRELDQRQTNQVQRRLNEARFPVLKTLEKTDLKKWPSLDAIQVREHLECHYITKRENIVKTKGRSHESTCRPTQSLRRNCALRKITPCSIGHP